MNYIKADTTITPYNSDAAEVLMAFMGEIGFESFLETPKGFEAYIQQPLFNNEDLNNLYLPFDGISFSFEISEIADENWNKEWEKNYFQPIIINNKCVVRSPFHEEFPHIPIQITIEPKMSFGTGHHETTSMMMGHILEHNFEGKRVLDMGCGTGILGILASITGAKDVVAIDIDKWCTDNSLENCELNNISNMEIILGQASSLNGMLPFDVILANINRNILLDDIQHYVKVLKPKGTLMLSGFYRHDLEAIDQCAQQNSLSIKNEKENNQWVAVTYEKE